MSTILVIDDDDDIREVLTLAIIEAGHAVIAAANGRTGVRKFAEQRPDLVLTDIIMPDFDGLELIAEIHSIDPGARIAAMSGGSAGMPPSYFVDTARKFGAMAVLAKPFKMAQLVQTIETCLRA